MCRLWGNGPSGAHRLPGRLAARLASRENVCPASGGALKNESVQRCTPGQISGADFSARGAGRKVSAPNFPARSGVSGRVQPTAPAGPRRGRTFRPSSARIRLPDWFGFPRHAGQIIRIPNHPQPSRLPGFPARRAGKFFSFRCMKPGNKPPPSLP